MRLDKFLKVSRLIKRRTVANEACDAGRVMVNGRPAKASTNVKVGDEIEILFGQIPCRSIPLWCADGENCRRNRSCLPKGTGKGSVRIHILSGGAYIIPYLIYNSS